MKCFEYNTCFSNCKEWQQPVNGQYQLPYQFKTILIYKIDNTNACGLWGVIPNIC